MSMFQQKKTLGFFGGMLCFFVFFTSLYVFNCTGHWTTVPFNRGLLCRAEVSATVETQLQQQQQDHHRQLLGRPAATQQQHSSNTAAEVCSHLDGCRNRQVHVQSREELRAARRWVERLLKSVRDSKLPVVKM